MIDVTSQFLDAIRATGLLPPPNIEPDKWYRFPGIKKGHTNTAGWCRLFPDGLGGCFGDWSSSLVKIWRHKHPKTFTSKERKIFAQYLAETKAQVKAERKLKQLKAAKTAKYIWMNASVATDGHPYLIRKNIQLKNLRIYKDSLVIKIFHDDKKFVSVQLIDPSGGKTFLTGTPKKGGYSIIGKHDALHPLIIAEGFATAASIYQSLNIPVFIAFDCGNIKDALSTILHNFVFSRIIIAADNDANNVGFQSAKKALERLNQSGYIIMPDTTSTDWNDVYVKENGKDIIKAAFEEVLK